MVILMAGCQALDSGVALRPSERVIGRAATSSGVVLLTDAPALIAIDLDRRTFSRRRVERDRDARKLWGLAETDGSLYSVEGFSDLVRLNPDGSRTRKATFDRPLGNLFDTREGMAGQMAIDQVSAPLAWSIGSTGSLSPIAGAIRQALGVSRAEEGVLHLLSCSAPPRVVCWLPGVPQLLIFDGRRFEAPIRLQSVGGVTPVRLLERPGMKVIQDALITEHGTLVAAIRTDPDQPATTLEEFADDGRRLRRIETPPEIRVLLGARAGYVVGITSTGHLFGVAL